MFDANLPEMLLQMKQRMERVKERLSHSRIEGISGGGLVKVVINGMQDVLSIEIDKDIIKEQEKVVMEDLILSAMNDAIKKSHKLLMEVLKEEFE